MVNLKRVEYWLPKKSEPLFDLDSTSLNWEGVATLGSRSGSGKTTLFRLLSGWFFFEGKTKLFGDFSPLGDVRFVGAHTSLLPWLSVKENILFKVPEILLERITELVSLVDLEPNVIDLYPYELSLGMYKRIELIIAVEQQPLLLLLDEFYSSIGDSQKEVIANYISTRRGNAQTWIVAHETDLKNWIGGPEYEFIFRDSTIIKIQQK